MRALAACVTLLRPWNLVAVALAAWVGSRLGGQGISIPEVLVPVLVAAFGYARNDAVDLAADRLNRPDRPLPAGRLAPRSAHAVASVALLLAGLAFAGSGRAAWSGSTGIAVAAALALYAYSPWLKDRGPAGPAVISLLTLLAVIWGAWGGPHAERAFLPALLAAVAQGARECVKQLEDAPGDRAVGRKTWVVTAGAARVTAAARTLLLAALLLLPLPATAGEAGARYLVAALPTAGVLFLVAFVALGGKAPRYGRISATLKLSLFAGLAALAYAA
jgi:geranylgeranylglycerol-phosphate geranylgeranyltransferase